MGRGKKTIKVVKQSTGINEDEIADLFAQLAGDPTKLDPEIVKDKYTRLKNNIERCAKILTKFKEVILDRIETKKGIDPFYDLRRYFQRCHSRRTVYTGTNDSYL